MINEWLIKTTFSETILFKYYSMLNGILHFYIPIVYLSLFVFAIQFVCLPTRIKTYPCELKSKNG